MIGTPIDHLDIVKGQRIRVEWKPGYSWSAMEYVANADRDHRGLDMVHYLMPEERSSNHVTTVHDRQLAAVAGDHVVAVLTVDGIDPSQGFVLDNDEARRLGTILIGLARQSELAEVSS